MKPTLKIDPAMGMAGDMFAAALMGLGAPEIALIAAMQTAGETLGDVTVQAERIALPDGILARRLYVLAQPRPPLRIVDARRYLDQALARANILGAYATFARRALDVLCRAETVAHKALSAPPPAHVSLTIIGHAHTPYQNRAPYQPHLEQDTIEDAFYVELDSAYAAGMSGLETFTHIFVLAYLDRSHRDTIWPLCNPLAQPPQSPWPNAHSPATYRRKSHLHRPLGLVRRHTDSGHQAVYPLARWTG